MRRKAFREYMNSILEERSKLSVLRDLPDVRENKTPSFNQYLREQLLTEEVNTHMTHIEDLVFDDGVRGTRKAINFFRDLRDTLSGHSANPSNLTMKYDGAPAIFAGTDPEDGRFFVAKKGIFNKNPKVYKTPEEVKADTKGDLQKKMLLALKYLPEIGIDGILQGDFMYDKDSLSKETIDGKEYITFHPNTIVYAVDVDSKLGRRIQRSKIGIVWHTRYTGDSLANLSGSFDANIAPGMKKSQNVWFDDASFKDLSGTATFTDDETKQVNELLSRAGKLFQSMKPGVINDIAKNDDLKKDLHVFMNMNVREGRSLGRASKMVQNMYEFFDRRYNEKIASMRSEKGQERWAAKKDEIMAYFKTHKSRDIATMFELIKVLTQIKMIFVNKLNEISGLGTFLKTSDGFKVTGQEGFVAIDRTGAGAVKLVDRLEFSKANFSPEFLKGWQ